MSHQQMSDSQQSKNTKDKMVQGSAWLTIGNIVSRLLGAIYILPWYVWMGENGDAANSLFGKGYNIYALFLMVSTAGIPSAIAKQISHYNSLNEYRLSNRLFKRSILLMIALGVVFALVMFISAPILADGNTNLIPTMRALSIGLLVFPCMSIIRGFFQGNHDMMPYAVSQIAEQIARVFYMLLATFIIMKMRNGDYVDAVTQSTFAAFIGMLAGMAVLLWYFRKQKPLFEHLEANSNNQLEISTNSLIKEMIHEAIPFIVVGSAITIFKIVDQYTFERIMRTFTDYSDAQLFNFFGLFSANADKLTMIVISLATSIAAATLPLVSEAFTQRNKKGLARLISEMLQLFFFIMVPAIMGMVIVAEPLYTLFYRHGVLGTKVLIEACLIGIILAFYMAVSSTLQGIYRNKEAVVYLGYGFLVKLVLQYPMIRIFETFGPLIATGIGLSVTSYFITRELYRSTKFNFSLTARRTLLIFILSGIMSIFAWISRQICYLVLSPTTKFQSLLIIIVVAAVGAAVYGYLILKLRLADKLLGEKVGGLRKKLRIN